MHMYMPWWRGDRKNDFPRGYHIEFGGGRHMPGVGRFDGLCNEHEGYGASLKQNVRSKYGNFIGFSGRGEMIPNPDTYCEIDPAWWTNGVSRCCASTSVERPRDQDGERYAGNLSRHRRSGGRNVSSAGRVPDAAQIPMESPKAERSFTTGNSAHGDDPKTSVLNKNCQAHDVKNLFVADGACFVTGPDKNPTLTITALSWRTSEYMLDQAKKGETIACLFPGVMC